MRGLLIGGCVAVAVAVAACGAVDRGVEGTVVLDQLHSWTPVGRGTSCNTNTPDFFVEETRYFRAFRLADHDIYRRFRVDSVAFTVSERVVGEGHDTFPITVSVHDYAGPLETSTLDLSQATEKASAVMSMGRRTGAVKIEQPLVAEIEADALLFVVHVPDRVAQKDKFFLGLSDQGETGTSYAACGGNAPATFAAGSVVNRAALMAVTGTSY